MSLVGVSRPSAEQHEDGEDAVARNIRQVVQRVSARKRQEVEMHVAAVVRHAQARAGGGSLYPRPAPVPRAQPPSEEALQARLASAAQAAAARAAQAASGADGGLFASGGDVQARTSTAADDNLQAQAAAALEAAKQRAARPAGAREHLQAQAAAALEAAKERATRPGAGGAGGVTPVPEAALQARARQAAGDAMERQRAAAYENSVEAKILWAMAAATYRSATEDSEDPYEEEAQEHDERKEVALGNGSGAAMTAVTAMKAVRFEEEVEVESPRKNFGGC